MRTFALLICLTGFFGFTVLCHATGEPSNDLHAKAEAYIATNRFREAIAVYDLLLEGNPKFENALNNRGFAYVLTGDMEAAEEDFRSALALSPDLELSLANLASLLINSDRRDEARPIVRKLITSYPENGEYERVWQVLSSR